jgi:hypothetical protein
VLRNLLCEELIPFHLLQGFQHHVRLVSERSLRPDQNVTTRLISVLQLFHREHIPVMEGVTFRGWDNQPVLVELRGVKI